MRTENNVLLINPVYEHLTTVLPPLGLAYIAATLEKNGVSVAILDANAYKMGEREIIRRIRSIEPNIIGITTQTALMENIGSLSEMIKREAPNHLLVFGGPHATVRPDECIEKYNADAVVRGEGEYTFLEVCQKYNGEGHSLNGILGVCYEEDGRIIHNKHRAFITTLDELPFPAYHLLPMTKYKTLGTTRKPFAPVLTSRGCPGKCMYCTKSIFGNRFRARSAGNVLEELRELVDKYHIREFDILDDAFSVDIERAEKICDAMIREKIDIPWRLSNGIRVDFFTEKLAKKLKSAGCYQISFGVESGDDEVLKKIGKEVTTNQIRTAFKITQKLGIETTGFFMLGLPFDTVETMGKTIKFALELDPGFVQFTITTPLPGTKLWRWVESNCGTLSKDVYNSLDFFGEQTCFETENFTKKDVEKLYRNAYHSFYYRPTYIIKRLFKIRSLEEVKRKVEAAKVLRGITRKGV